MEDGLLRRLRLGEGFKGPTHKAVADSLGVENVSAEAGKKAQKECRREG
jgi:hypothetical protein